MGRRRQTNQLTGLGEIRSRLAQSYTAIPETLKYGEDVVSLGTRPLTLQMQAIALSLAYDNLQLVLHRQAVFTSQSEQRPLSQRQKVVEQLLESALPTSNITRYPATSSVCKASHTAMHVGICALTAGVILCGLLLTNSCLNRRNELLGGLQLIIGLFHQLSGYAYSLTNQSLQILNTFKSKILVPIAAELELADPTTMQIQASRMKHFYL